MLLQDNPPVTIDSNGRLFAPTWCLVEDTGNTLSISMATGEPAADLDLTFPNTIGVPDGEVLGLLVGDMAWIPTGTGNVGGPGVSTINAISMWASATRDLLQDNPTVTVDAIGQICGRSLCITNASGGKTVLTIPAAQTGFQTFTFPDLPLGTASQVLGLVSPVTGQLEWQSVI